MSTEIKTKVKLLFKLKGNKKLKYTLSSLSSSNGLKYIKNNKIAANLFKYNHVTACLIT